MTVDELFDLCRSTFREWSADKAPQLGAALAYYSLFSIAPLLIIAVSIAGWVFGESAAQGQLSSQLHDTVGPGPARAIEDLIVHTRSNPSGPWATVIGTVTLLVGAAGLFGQLQDAMNTIWKVEPKSNRGWLAVLRERSLPFAMVVAGGFLLIVSLVASAVLAEVAQFLRPEALPGGAGLWQALNSVVSFGFFVLVFALIYREVPDVRIAWGDVWPGALVTALLFSAGKYLIGLYLGHSGATSAYGAAGSLVLVLLWVYYSSQIFLFGAEFTRVYA
jgi:membrane protein